MTFANFLDLGVPHSQPKRKLINISGERDHFTSGEIDHFIQLMPGNQPNQICTGKVHQHQSIKILHHKLHPAHARQPSKYVQARGHVYLQLLGLASLLLFCNQYTSYSNAPSCANHLTNKDSTVVIYQCLPEFVNKHNVLIFFS